MMCYVCCKELKGWCKSFTRTEGLLTILEAVLLIIFIGFFVFLVLHFVACQIHLGDKNVIENSTVPTVTTTVSPSVTSTLSPDVECTWEPSQKTTAHTRYYVSDSYTADVGHHTPGRSTTTKYLGIFDEALRPSHYYDEDEFLENSNGEPAGDIYKNQVVALVKFKPPRDVTFGCILTKITQFWTLTAASCIASIEEVDSLDSFVMIEQFGEADQSPPRHVAAVRLHPRYQGHSRAHDLAALRSARALRARAPLLHLPHMLDYFLMALGERLLILGYGGYRTVDKAEGRRLRQVSVFVTAAAACGGTGPPGWARRHLARGAAVADSAASGAAPLCAGARWARGAACNYCAGAPLVRGGALLGIMSDNSECGVTCEPQIFVNLAALRDWIDNFTD
ncbi:unnamed protein product [Spodoptera littoralis]|uniref:Peptidase S1 domain-containing protein n=1 Tax=Spodoptera littoralis TaxID=7109 RepID=A0A9P0ID99_SPOLI|nr:unnamed protein product [Spodoptera littoralis]CAH1643796.1 unnamed protein product [Spodoptera littoralis]